MFQNEQQYFIGFGNTRRSRVFLDPIKHELRVFWAAKLKTIAQKARPSEATKAQNVQGKISAYKKTSQASLLFFI